MSLNLRTRPQPVLFFQFLAAIVASAVLLIVVVTVTQISNGALQIIATLVGGLVTVGGAALFGISAAKKVTPVDDPQNDTGERLVPPPSAVPPSP